MRQNLQTSTFYILFWGPNGSFLFWLGFCYTATYVKSLTMLLCFAAICSATVVFMSSGSPHRYGLTFCYREERVNSYQNKEGYKEWNTITSTHFYLCLHVVSRLAVSRVMYSRVIAELMLKIFCNKSCYKNLVYWPLINPGRGQERKIKILIAYREMLCVNQIIIGRRNRSRRHRHLKFVLPPHFRIFGEGTSIAKVL